MALTDIRLSILAFPQRWSPNGLEARVLLIPTGDPTLPPAGTNLPAFAATQWNLRATVLPGLDGLLGPDPGAASGAVPIPFTATPPAGAAELFQALQMELEPQPPAPLAQRQLNHSGLAVRKHLPESYTKAFAFERPGPGTSVGDEFGCALRDTKPAERTDPKPPDTLTWGAVLSFALRQPIVARALGLIYDLPQIVIPAPASLAAGGWLYVDLDPDALQPAPAACVRSYAARLPALAPLAERPLFAAVLLPVGLTAAGSYDAALGEAALYDDGFAKIVHSAQARTADAASSGHNVLRPATDAGLDLGWDDEQITVWLNRQLDTMRARLDPLRKADVEAPLGVSGYRVDVRMPEAPAFNDWHSLCVAFSADAEGNPAPLSFPPAPAQPAFSAFFDGELSVEPTPVRSIHASDGRVWLPQHFTRWQGGSLVVNDPTLYQLGGTAPNDSATPPQPIVVPPSANAPRPPLVPLRYGSRYEFRCRFADLTGGGPDEGSQASNPAPAPVASSRFLRFVPPKAVRLESDVPRPAFGAANVALATVGNIDVWRPLIGYPELVFAGIDDPAVVQALLAAAPAARAAGDGVGVNDPDVTDLRVSVQVRSPAHDSGPVGLRDGDYRELYTVQIPFPLFDAADVINPGVPLSLVLEYLDAGDVAAIPAPAAGSTLLPVPRARDVRIRLTPICADKPDYFGEPWAREGLTVDVATRADAVGEAGLFANLPIEQQLNCILLRPAANMMGRLADQLRLAASGLTLSGRHGERVVFGASGALRHSLSGDHGAVTFASGDELLGHWIAAISLTVERDWTWDGLHDEGLLVARSEVPGAPFMPNGQIRIPFTISASSIAGPDVPAIDRRAATRVVYFDVVDPNPPPGAFPTTPTPQWSVEPQLRGLPAAGAALAWTASIRLPVAVRPRQTPKLVSAGHALSPYRKNDDYSATEARRRVLWFEFAEPVEDPDDALYARVLSYGPDPLLSGAITHKLLPVPEIPVGPNTLFDVVEQLLPHPPPPPPLPIDPEPIRVIVPGQPEDSSGLNAMTQMPEGSLAAGETRSRFFIVPLPEGLDPDAPELFGFWTYELCVGHRDIWSTAQERFGRSLIVNGVQHPPPSLSCAAFRVNPSPPAAPGPPRITVTAPFATAVFEDKRLTETPMDPRTRIWVLLYAQVVQADGVSRRNVLVARAPAWARFDADRSGKPLPPRTRDVVGVAQFEVPAVHSALEDLALPADAPLSVIAVELLPGDRLTQTAVRYAEQSVFIMFDVPEGNGDVDAPLTFSRAPSGVPSDPLGKELGSMTSRRILRCSPLTPVAPAC